MITKAEARRLVHKLTVDSLRRHGARKLFKGSLSERDFTKLQLEQEALADFLEKRGKIDSNKTDVGGKSGHEEAEVPSVRKPEA